MLDTNFCFYNDVICFLFPFLYSFYTHTYILYIYKKRNKKFSQNDRKKPLTDTLKFKHEIA